LFVLRLIEPGVKTAAKRLAGHSSLLSKRIADA
jgi:hypothetical protein